MSPLSSNEHIDHNITSPESNEPISVSGEISDTIKISEARNILEQKNQIFEQVSMLPQKEQIEFLKYIASISLDDGINMILQIYHAEKDINSILIPTILSLDVIKHYETYMKRVYKTLEDFIKKNPNIEKGTLEKINAYMRAPKRRERLTNFLKIKGPDVIIRNEKRMLYEGMYVKEYQLDKPLELSKGHPALKDLIDDYYANLLIHKEYAPVELSINHNNKNIVSETLRCVDFIEKAEANKDKGEWKGELYPYANGKQLLIDDVVHSIQNDLPEGYAVLRDEQLKSWILVSPDGVKDENDYSTLFLDHLDGNGLGDEMTINDLCMGYKTIFKDTGKEDGGTEMYYLDFFGESRPEPMGYEGFYSNDHNQVQIARDKKGCMHFYDRYGMDIQGPHQNMPLKSSFKVRHLPDGTITIIARNREANAEMGMVIPVSRPGLVSLQTKKKLFLLNCIDDQETGRRAKFLSLFNSQEYHEELETVMASNYFMDTPLSHMMLKEKEGVKKYMGKFVGLVKNEVGVYRVIKNLFQLYEPRPKNNPNDTEKKLRNAVFGDNGKEMRRDDENPDYLVEDTTSAKHYLETLHQDNNKLSEQNDRDRFDKNEKSDSRGGNSADLEKMKDTEIMRLSEPINNILSYELLSDYDGEFRNKVAFNYAPQIWEPVKSIDVSITFDNYIRPKVLPKNINSLIDEVSIQCVNSAGAPTDFQIEVDDAGYVAITPSEGGSTVTYTLVLSATNPTIPHTSKREYAELKAQFLLDNPDCNLDKDLGRLPLECEGFIQAAQKMAPREQILAVEDFIVDTRYYDDDNDEKQQKRKEKQSLSMQMQLCMDRVTDLHIYHPEKKDGFAKKMFAGVCHDMQIFRMMLHRKLGLLSGYNGGYKPNPDQTSVKVTDAHSAGFVIFLDENGEPMVVEVDGIIYHPDGTLQGGSKNVLQKEQEDRILQKEQEKKKDTVTISSKEKEKKRKKVEKEALTNIKQLIEARKAQGKPEEGLLYAAIQQKYEKLTPKNKVIISPLL